MITYMHVSNLPVLDVGLEVSKAPHKGGVAELDALGRGCLVRLRRLLLQELLRSQ